MKVITFSRYFPKTHPKAGQPTYFVEKILASLDDCGIVWTPALQAHTVINSEVYKKIKEGEGKHHTIRAGNRWKAGDQFSPRIWSGKPYASKQIEFAPPITILKTVNFYMTPTGSCVALHGNRFAENEKVDEIAKNDGLSREDFYDWFATSKSKYEDGCFRGQILIWNKDVDY